MCIRDSNNLNRQKRTKEAAALITDEILNTIAIVGEPQDAVAKLRTRLAGYVSRTGFSVTGMADDTLVTHLAALTEN